MALVDMRDMLSHAYENGYAVGAFGLANFEFLEAIMQAAENSRAPVILNLSAAFHSNNMLALVLPAVEAAARRASVPVAIHYDHAADLASAIHAINQGCNGIMLDTSGLALDQKIIATKQMVETARACGIAVEGDLGGMLDDEENTTLTTPAEAKAFVDRTGVDFLAVAVGNQHGQNKTKLDFTRLKQIHAAVKCPLVIHGGSGLSEEQLRRLVMFGVAKINYFTHLADLAAESIRNQANSHKNADYITLKQDVKDILTKEIERCMRIWGSAGRAAEVQSRCATWKPAEHLLVYNLNTHLALSAEAVMREGHQVLSQIPGVREVFNGQAIQENCRYKFCWRVKFAHAQVLTNYQKHPSHVAFTNRYLKPLADDSLTLSYQEVA